MTGEEIPTRAPSDPSCLTGEGLHDEATQGTIGNLLNGEVCEFHCCRDLHVWPVFETLNALLDLIWVNRTGPDHSG